MKKLEVTITLLSDSEKAKELTINTSEAKDRQDLFNRICVLLKKDNTKLIEKIGIKAPHMMSINNLIDLCKIHKLPVVVDFLNNKMTVFCPVMEMKGAAVINAPQHIQTDNEADFAPVGKIEQVLNSEEDEDDDPLA